jgi:hypothetical protein
MYDQASISPYSLVVVATLMVSSQFWQPDINAFFLESSALNERQKEVDSDRVWVSEDRVRLTLENEEMLSEAHRGELSRLRQENLHLRKVLSQSKTMTKHGAEDVRFLAAEVMGRYWRQSGAVAVLNVGQDYAVREGDWLVHLGAICGKVVAVSGYTSLVVDLSGSDVRALVRVEGIEGEVIWEGIGSDRGVVRVRRGGEGSLLGRSVHLSVPLSAEGAYLVGEVIDEKPDRRGGWLRLEVQGRRIPHQDILFVMQRHESSSADLFAQRDRLDELRREMRRLERNKLRLELLRP